GAQDHWLLAAFRRRELSLASHLFFHLFAGLEGDDLLRLDIDAFSSARIAGFTSFAHLDFEHANVPQLGPADLNERVDNAVKGLLNDFFGFELGQPDAIGNLFDDLFLGHDVGSPNFRSGPIRLTRCETLQV